MLDAVASPNLEPADGYTCLLTAIESSDIEILDLLLKAGANINTEGINGNTPLHKAVIQNDIPKAQLLLDAGANVDQRKSIDGYETPLMEAAFFGHANMVEFLLRSGADPSLKDCMMDRTALDIAIESSKGCDIEVYKSLKDEDFTMYSELHDDTDLAEDQKALLKNVTDNIDMAEHYKSTSNEISSKGHFERTIDLLTPPSLLTRIKNFIKSNNSQK